MFIYSFLHVWYTYLMMGTWSPETCREKK